MFELFLEINNKKGILKPTVFLTKYIKDSLGFRIAFWKYFDPLLLKYFKL
jgi:hypothetical protein